MSGIKEKIRILANSENRWLLIKQKISGILFEIRYKRSYGELGKKCRITQPLYITGKRYIFLRGGG